MKDKEAYRKGKLELREMMADRGIELTPEQVNELIYEIENLPFEEWASSWCKEE